MKLRDDLPLWDALHRLQRVQTAEQVNVGFDHGP